MMWRGLCVIIILIQIYVSEVVSHGSLIEPPARNVAWKKGFSMPPNYSYKSLFCGGKSVQWNKYNGKCGECGDSYDPEKVQEHSDLSGKYVKSSVIVKTYTQGANISVTVELTAYHEGWFEFRLCKLINSEEAPTSRNTRVTQECLDENLLTAYVGGEATKRIDLEKSKSEIKTGNNFIFTLKLPDHIYCDFCVLQWWYKTGNSWACDDDGCCTGCGAQETFVNCADIAITPTNIRYDEESTNDNAPNENPNVNKPASGSFDSSRDDLLDIEKKQLKVMVWSARQTRKTAKFLEQELTRQLQMISDQLEEIKYNLQNRK